MIVRYSGLWLALLLSLMKSTSSKECAKLDIAMVVDASGSILNNWSRLKAFIVDLTGQLDVRLDRVRVGVIKFGSAATLEFSLDSFDTHQELKSNVEAMKLLGGKTNTADALRLLRTDFFTTNNGDRTSIDNIAIVITDGKSNERPEQTIPEANLARAAGIRLVAVGIGQDEEGRKELEGIAGGPDLVIAVKHIDSLSDFIQNTTAIACTPLPTSPCGLRADLVFLLDASSSITFTDKRNWDPRLLGFTRSVANSFTIGKNATHVGIVRFSDKAQVIIDLNQYYDASRLGVEIRNIAHTGGGTNIAEGLKVMREQAFQEEKGDRPDVSNIALIITDGKANTNTKNIIPEAEAAKKAGIEIYAIGVSDVDMAELSSIVSPPVKDHIFNVTNYETIGSTLNNFLIQACPSTTTQKITTTKVTTPKVSTPKLTSSKVTTPKVTIPNVTTPKVTTPKVTTPKVTTPKVTTPKVTTPKVTTPKVTTPKITTPKITTKKVTTQEEITTEDITSPIIITQELSTKRVNTPKVTTSKVIITKIVTPEITTQKETTQEVTKEELSTQKVTSNIGTSLEVITQDVTTQKVTIPKVTSSKVTSPEVTETEVETTQKKTTTKVSTTKITTPKIITPKITTPIITTPTITTTTITTTKITSPDITTSREVTEITTPFTTLRPNPDLCNNEMDVIFALDSSTGSVDQYAAMLNFTSELVSLMDVESGRIRIGVMSYNTKTTVEIKLNQFKSRSTLVNVIKSMPMRSGRTDQTQALYHMRKKMFLYSNGGRVNVKKVALVITDGGGGRDVVNTIKQGVLAKSAGIEIIAIGAGGWVDINMLEGIASYPSFKHAFKIQSWNLLSLVSLVTKTICSENNECDKDENECKNNGTCVIEQAYNLCECKPGFAGKKCEHKCIGSADVVIAIDASGSIHKVNYYSVINFVSDLVQEFNVDVSNSSDLGMRVGLLTFADHANFQFNLNSQEDKVSLLNSLSAGYSPNGKTNTAEALKYIRENMFKESVGDRKHVLNFVIIITDGKSDNAKDTWIEAMKLRGTGAIVLAVAVGSSIDYTELEAIASSPHSETVVRSLSFSALNSALATRIASPVCQNTNACKSNPCLNGANCTSSAGGYSCNPCPRGYTGVNCERDCDGELDLVFVLDNSGSIRNERFPLVLDFVSNITAQLDVSPHRVRVGVITFSTRAKVQFYLNQYSSKQDIIQAISYTKFDSNGQTHTAAGLALLRKEMFSPVHGHRPGIRKFSVIITDGNSNIDEVNTIPQAILAHLDGIHIVAVPVGRAFVNFDEIEGLASRPKQQNIISIDSMQSLASIIANVTDSMCNDYNNCASSPCQNGGICDNQLKQFVCKCQVDYTGNTCGRQCSNTIDLVFLLDLSGSLEKQYRMTVLFAQAVVAGLPTRYDRARVGLISYSSSVLRQFHMNAYKSRDELQDAMSFHRSRPAGRTNTYAAIREARLNHFTAAAGDRPLVRNVVVLVTDGNWNIDSSLTIPEMQRTKDADIDIYSIAVGESPNTVNLEEAASYPSTDYYKRLETLNDIQTTADNLLDDLCN